MCGRVFILLAGVGLSLVVAVPARGQSPPGVTTNRPALPPQPPAPPPFPPPAVRPPGLPGAPRLSVPQPPVVARHATNAPANYVPMPRLNSGTNATPRPVARPVVRPAVVPFPLTVDADVKETTARPGETNVLFTFKLGNPTTNTVTVDQVRTSCGCTVARLPAQPWNLAPGESGEFQVALDLRGKRGTLSKQVYVYTARAFKSLTVRVLMEDASLAAGTNEVQNLERMTNMRAAAADRQAVFRGDCASCHVEPGRGRSGRELFQAVCGVCHEAEHRASMVPDLGALKHATDREHWNHWIRQGKARSLMPAFAQSEGGPLNDAQIESLVDYLVQRFPSRPDPAVTSGPGGRPAPQPPASGPGGGPRPTL